MTERQPDHAAIMFALGQMHSDIKTAMGDIEELKDRTTDRLNSHSSRISSLEKTRTRAFAYMAGLSAGIFTIGTALKDKIGAILP